jgi:hypothetical protein
MEEFRKLVLEANRKLRLADHMAYITYPMLKETKLLLTVLDNLDKSLKASLNAYLHYERLYKRISPYPDDLKTKLEIFERGPAKRYNLQNYSKLIIEVNNILKKHKESPMAFVKKDKLVICNRDYRMKVLEIADAKNYLAKAKPFILMLSNILKENDADTRRQR